MAEPLKVIAGDTWTWSRPGGAYLPGDGWTLTYLLSTIGGAVKTITAAPSGTDFVVLVAAADTASWPAGSYVWTARAMKGTEAFTVETGRLQVMPNPATSAYAGTHAERTLAAIERALEGCFGDAVVEFDMDGLKVKKNRTELLDLRDRYKAEVKRERGGSGLRRIPVRLR